jgi:murein DD-endopeptidase MepM/ murein hydrolase activator NlpD
MSNNKGNGSFAGKGYYIALILCAAAIGITSYVYTRNVQQPQEAAVQETWEDVQVGTPGTEDVAVIATEGSPASSQPSAQTAPSTQTQPSTVPVQKKPLKPVSPVSGEEIFGYSMEALSYNQTTRDWRTHNGIDLAAEAGAEVRAAADGEVYAVRQEDSLGYTVVIRHDDGYTTCYSSLTENIPVKPGDQVVMGDVIGYAGDSAVAEATLGAHVHFSVTRYEEPIDPAEFLSLGQ